jgi:hypothetical protein
MIRPLNSPLRPEPHATAILAIGSSREHGLPVPMTPKMARTTPLQPANCRPTGQFAPHNAPSVGRPERPARTRTRVILLDNQLGNQEKCIASVYRSSPKPL